MVGIARQSLALRLAEPGATITG